MVSNVPPTSDPNPPLDGGLNISASRKALLLLEQIKRQIDDVEALIQTAGAQPNTGAPPPRPQRGGKRKRH